VICGDASYFIALADEDDRWHPDAVRLRGRLEDESLLVTGFTVAEAVTHVGGLLGGKAGRRLHDFFMDSCEVTHVDAGLLSDGMVHWLTYDGRLSVQDATSVALMVRRGVNRVASYDDDYDRVRGIKRLH